MRIKKLWNMEVAGILIVIGVLGTIIKRLAQGWEDFKIRGRVEIGQNTEKSPEDLRRLSVTQTQVKNHQLMLVWKTIIMIIIIIIIIIIGWCTWSSSQGLGKVTGGILDQGKIEIILATAYIS